MLTLWIPEFTNLQLPAKEPEYLPSSWSGLPSVRNDLQIPKYVQNLDIISRNFALKGSDFREAIGYLAKIGIIEVRGNTASVLKPHLILPADQNFLSIQNHANWRVHAMKHRSLKENSDYFLTGLFVADRATKAELRDMIVECISRFQPKVRDAPCEEVFQLNIDLYSV